MSNMLEVLLGILSSSGLGGIVGGIFSLFGKKEDNKSKEMDYEHEHRMALLGLEETRLVNSHQIVVEEKQLEKSKIEGEQKIEEVEATAFKENVKSAIKITGIYFVDAVRFLVRPVITAYLLIIASILAFNIATLAGGLESLPAEEIMYLYRYVLSQIFFLTTTAVVWWYGSRKQGNALKI